MRPLPRLGLASVPAHVRLSWGPLRFDSLAVRCQVHREAGTPSLFQFRKPGLGDES